MDMQVLPVATPSKKAKTSSQAKESLVVANEMPEVLLGKDV